MSLSADSNGLLARRAIGLLLVMALPPLRALFESSMALHMLVQLPLIAAAGFCLGLAWRQSGEDGFAARALARAQSFNAGGLTGLLFASFVMVLWMLPRLLDLARLDPSIDAFKFATVALAGLAVALSWPRLPVIARAVVHLEVIATLLRFGWGYVAADERLCLVYLAGDQRVTGELLIFAGVLYAVLVAWKPMFGSIVFPRRAEPHV